VFTTELAAHLFEVFSFIAHKKTRISGCPWFDLLLQYNSFFTLGASDYKLSA
jgi:hypothetical protein